MGKALLEARRPPMWAIETQGCAGGREVRFGAHRIAIVDIAALSLEEVRDQQATGLFVAATAFLLAAGILAYCVFEAGARERFLLGTFFLGGLGIAGLIESLRLRRTSHFELTLTLKDGRRTVFTSADRADIAALALRLAAERGADA